ncbi:MAG TPA: FAD-binding protein [Adlercreutzia equolifaciens]|uniref:FAD-binding protein n=1 Tax=Adlercreutzia equolifaciens TaxID=446660 RepID=UPI00242A5E2E|nr:FAD-binding protein [Adlercreutzia equolifaciens]HJI12763.1 FAD-binding protein [Adlercreutzia equolifaciens]
MGNETLSRRAFLKGAATTGTLAMAGSFLGCAPASQEGVDGAAKKEGKGAEGSLSETDGAQGTSEWLGVQPELPDFFDEEVTADIVVLGAGVAGVSACRAAIEAGATVALFEKSSGVSSRSQDYVCLGSSWMAEHFPSIPDMDEIKWDFLHATAKGSLLRTKDAIWAKWADLNGAYFDWWIGAVPEDELSSGSEQNGNKPEEGKHSVTIKMWPMPAHYAPSDELYPSFAGTAVLMGAEGGGCLAFTQANYDKACEVGGDRLATYFEAPAERLITDDSGKVTGAVIRCFDGRVIRANADKAVILATGDFLNNMAMMEQFCPREVRCGYTPEKTIYPGTDKNGDHLNVGDGHKMGMWAGARMQVDGCCMTHMEKQEVEAIGTDPCLWLDKTGNRFMNEDCQACHMSQRLDELPDKTIFQIFDGSILDDLEWMPYGHHRVVNQTQEGLDEAVEAGALLRADTLDELFSQIEGLDVEAAKATVERYNQFCAAGKDDDFGKTPSRLFAVDTPPFYCVTWGGNVSLVTLSGLESDENCHVYREDGSILPGLYVCGNVQGNRWALEYAETALGMSHAMALTYGRVAAENAVNGV